jgi:hypothetical protein
MPNTYILIASNTLASNALSVTFSSIPASYTDLVIRFSYRTLQSGSTDSTSNFVINGILTNIYSATRVFQDGATCNTSRITNATNGSSMIAYGGSGAGTTANTFGNAEIYIPSYLSSQNKPYYSAVTSETDSANTSLAQIALLWRNTGSINQVTLESASGSNYVTGSSFYLYGIKNS